MAHHGGNSMSRTSEASTVSELAAREVTINNLNIALRKHAKVLEQQGGSTKSSGREASCFVKMLGGRKMTLTFPTIAEQALAKFRSAKKTTSLVTVAKHMKADVERRRDCTIYTFDDDTGLIVTGRGRAHKVEVTLP